MIIDDKTKKVLEAHNLNYEDYLDVDLLLHDINEITYSVKLTDPLVEAYFSILKSNKKKTHNLKLILKYHQKDEIEDIYEQLEDKEMSSKELLNFLNYYSSIIFDDDVYLYNEEFIKCLYNEVLNLDKELLDTHKYTYNNKELLKKSLKNRCFYCQEYVSFSDILSFIDNGETGICPYCNTPSLLPDKTAYIDNSFFLEAMSKRWYKDINDKFLDGVALYDNFYMPSLNFSFEDKIITKGKNYYYNGYIKDFTVNKTKELTRIISKVKKDITYNVDVRIKDNMVKYMSCDCPSNSNCKHEYAVLMKYLRDNYSYQSEILILENITEWLEKRSIVVTFSNEDYIPPKNSDININDLLELLNSSVFSIYNKDSLLNEILCKDIMKLNLEEAITYLVYLANSYKADKGIIKKFIDNGKLLILLKTVLDNFKAKEKKLENVEVI